jgi:hypothetical protein
MFSRCWLYPNLYIPIKYAWFLYASLQIVSRSQGIPNYQYPDAFPSTFPIKKKHGDPRQHIIFPSFSSSVSNFPSFSYGFTAQ